MYAYVYVLGRRKMNLNNIFKPQLYIYISFIMSAVFYQLNKLKAQRNVNMFYETCNQGSLTKRTIPRS